MTGVPLDESLQRKLTADEIAARRAEVRAAVLATSPHVREPNFTRIGPRDLGIVFERYDALFFGGAIVPELGERPLTFRLSQRATRRGGSLRVSPPRQTPGGPRPEAFELTVSTTLLFESFRGGSRSITVAGHDCSDRLDALQRVLEHEVVHLVEHLRWRDTNCSGTRFQAIARRVFGHLHHKHELVTPRESAAELGLRVGERVAFEFEGTPREGILARVTKRATVLVPHSNGEPMSDGRRYLRFYVPLQLLRRA